MEEKYAAVFKHLPQPAVLLDTNGAIDDFNEAALACFAVGVLDGPLLEWLDQDLKGFCASGDVLKVIEKDFDLGADRAFFRVRMAKMAPDKRHGPLVLIFTDITERRRNLEQLGRLAAIVESSEDAIISISLEGTILSWNQGAEHIYGYSAAELLGSSIFKIVPEDLHAEVHDHLLKVAEGGTVPRLETMRRHKRGFLFPVSATFSPYEYNRAVVGVSIISRDISGRKRVERELKDSHQRMTNILDETVRSLSAVHEQRDLYTSGHQTRVSQVACELARMLGLGKDDLEALRVAGLLHDIGKVCIPMAILSKPAQLSDGEMAILKQHPGVGRNILGNIPFQLPVGEIIFQHHERLDGSGYPQGLMEGDILPSAKILAMADVLEAMSSHRPYRPALGIRVAMDEFRRGSGSIYDPDVLDALEYLVRTDRICMGEGGQLSCR